MSNEAKCNNCQIEKARTSENFHRNKNHSSGFSNTCKTCANKKLAKSYRKHREKRVSGTRRKMTIEEAKKLFKDNGAVLLADEFTNQKDKYHYICSCGESHYKTIVAFKESPMCTKCYDKTRVKLTLKEVREHLRSISMEFLDEEYLGVGFEHNIKCVCGRNIKKNFHSIQKGYLCQDCGMDKRRGENSPRWNPELTDEDRGRWSPEYRLWRKRVLQRDSGKCLKCNESEKSLHVHHIIPYEVSKELRTEVSNGATLCASCHNLLHLTYELKDINANSLKEFLGGRKW